MRASKLLLLIVIVAVGVTALLTVQAGDASYAPAFSVAGTEDAAPTPTSELDTSDALDMTEVALEFAGQVNPRILPRPARRLSDWQPVPFQSPCDVLALANAPEATTIDTAASDPLAPPSLLSSFDGLDSADNPSGLHPPDPQLPVGPTHLLDLVHIIGRISVTVSPALSPSRRAHPLALPARLADYRP